MSGGHWDYSGFKLMAMLHDIADDVDVRRRWPATSRALKALGDVLSDLEHEMDWDLSGDSEIDDDASWDARAASRIAEASRPEDRRP